MSYDAVANVLVSAGIPDWWTDAINFKALRKALRSEARPLPTPEQTAPIWMEWIGNSCDVAQAMNWASVLHAAACYLARGLYDALREHWMSRRHIDCDGVGLYNVASALLCEVLGGFPCGV